jgi:alkylation response protein AidB-like acyl-CoA dehydrogenase
MEEIRKGPYYSVPLREQQFILEEFLDIKRVSARWGNHEKFNPSYYAPTFAQMAEFAENEIFPLNLLGDRIGYTYRNGKALSPPGFREAYQKFCHSGWPLFWVNPKYGGRGMPNVLTNVMFEIFSSANFSFYMLHAMSRGCFLCILAGGTSEQKKMFLPALAIGRWTASICISEELAGSDIGIVETVAEPQSDGSYLLSGLKIMATNAEHDLAENILYIVLARITGEPQGMKGLSLFVVPKFSVLPDGCLGKRNSVMCEGLDDKMGTRGSPTGRIRFDRAKGTLLGQKNAGLAAMFVMLNSNRISTATQGFCHAEVAYQNAVLYARKRRQGRRPSSKEATSPIIEHPDVKRMLMIQKSYIEASRAFAYWLELELDRLEYGKDESERHDAADLVALLTPVAKGFITDIGYLCTTLAQQVTGGWGYMSDSGMDQYVRDSRVAQIFEGTNGIQALDLLKRQIIANDARSLKIFIEVILKFCRESESEKQNNKYTSTLIDLCQKVSELTKTLQEKAKLNIDLACAAAVNYMHVIGHLVFAFCWARMAHIAFKAKKKKERENESYLFYDAKLVCADFYFSVLLKEAQYHIQAASSAGEAVIAIDSGMF